MVGQSITCVIARGGGERKRGRHVVTCAWRPYRVIKKDFARK